MASSEPKKTTAQKTKVRNRAGVPRSPSVRAKVDQASLKEKVSLTLDKPLVDEIRAQFGGRALSTSINELLYAALAQERLSQLVDEMEQEAGPPSPEAYERVFAQWFVED
jgi:uncharacterized protein (DUF4415 family)